MQRILRVRNWEKHFETSETRKYVHLKWIPITNNQSDAGYAKLMNREDGPQIFGAWIAILQAASRCKKRGSLAEGDGTAYDLPTLAAVTRMPLDLITKAVEVLTTEIKWLQWFGESSSETPGDSPGTSSLNGTERNGIELNRISDHVDVSSKNQSREINPDEGAHDARKLASIMRPTTQQDRVLIAQVCVLKQTGPLSQRAVWDAAEAVRVKGAEVRKPIAYFREVLTDNATKEKHNLAALLASTRPPPELIAACLEKSDPRLCTERDESCPTVK